MASDVWLYTSECTERARHAHGERERGEREHMCTFIHAEAANRCHLLLGRHTDSHRGHRHLAREADRASDKGKLRKGKGGPVRRAARRL